MLLNVQIKNSRLFLSLLVVSHAGIVTSESLWLEPFNLQDCLEAPLLPWMKTFGDPDFVTVEKTCQTVKNYDCHL